MTRCNHTNNVTLTERTILEADFVFTGDEIKLHSDAHHSSKTVGYQVECRDCGFIAYYRANHYPLWIKRLIRRKDDEMFKA